MLPIEIELNTQKTLIASSVNGSPLTLVEAESLSAVSNGYTKDMIKSEVSQFGNIFIYLHSLGSASYRIEWQSKMTGASVSLSRTGRNKYSVMRKWAPSKKLHDISSSFDTRKQALVHFFSNVDIIKSAASVIDDAKNKVLELFTKLEGVNPIQKKTFPRVRLQGAIGMKVEVRAKGTKRDRIIATGILMQIVGTTAEVKIQERIDLGPSQLNLDFIKFNMNQVYLV